MPNSDWPEAYCRLRDTIIEDHYHHLNPAQKEAVLHTEGPCLVLAGAGSGKTTMLVNRIGHIIRFGSVYGQTNPPEKITEEDYDKLKEWYAGIPDATAPKPLAVSRLLE